MSKKQSLKIKKLKSNFRDALRKLDFAADAYEEHMSDIFDIDIAVSGKNEAVINLYDPECDIHSSYRLKDLIKALINSDLAPDDKVKSMTVWLREMLSASIKLDKALKKSGVKSVDVEVE